ncbi:predicted protein [Plenodomus lingam JN3]|uniref:Predicted protein n=1 Tax=Leptosphaeria maculans (strain JN3 / isolate v23.1.3 / race Av1-4-5-6-7-8) TaxID=985895 RepID=E5A927_LEPMJ|nr:predicted protein [Plenodomus lingam JN3]CBY00122.1 predicted protein [Plenodomus lingam JN3]
MHTPSKTSPDNAVGGFWKTIFAADAHARLWSIATSFFFFFFFFYYYYYYYYYSSSSSPSPSPSS